MAVELGDVGRAVMVVSDDDTALAHGTGDVPVLSTPALLRLMQQSTMDALDGKLDAGVITAGLRANIDHLHGTPVGSEITATCTLIRIEGRRLVFEAEATSDGTTVGIGRIIRVQIDRDRFLSRL